MWPGLGTGNLTIQHDNPLALVCLVFHLSQLTHQSAPSKDSLWHFYRINTLSISFLPKGKTNYQGEGLGLIGHPTVLILSPFHTHYTSESLCSSITDLCVCVGGEDLKLE